MTILKKLRPTLIALVIIVSLFNINAIASENPWTKSYELEAQKKYREAAELIEPFINTGIKSEFAMLRIAWLSYLSQNYNESIKQYQDALAFNANSIDARLGLMLPLMAQSRWREASFHGEQILAIAPWQYYAHIRLMACEAAQSQWDKLNKHAATFSERFPTDTDSLIFLARANIKLNNTEIVKSTYRKVLERYPNNIEALQYLVSH